jgi:dipeptidyl aminopeptidase/acylaminoacyl peptidase
MRNLRRFGLQTAVLVTSFLAAISARANEPPPIEAYGKLPAIESARLSPDGNAVAYLSSVAGRRCLVIHDLDSRRPNSGVCPGDYEVRSFSWKTSRRLILEVYQQTRSTGVQQRTISQLVAIDVSGRGIATLSPARPERAADFGDDQLIDRLPGDPEHVLIAAYPADGDSPDVIRVNVETGRGRTIVEGRNHITTWKTDSAGQVRLGEAVHDGMVRVFYRADDRSDFHIIHQVDAAHASTFQALAPSDQPGILYVASTAETGRRAIYRYDVAGDRFIEPYASHPDVDIGALLISGGQPLGYSYTVDEPTLVFTDAAARMDAEQVAAALPEFHTRVVDGTADGHRLLILAAGGNRPAIYYLLTRDKEQATLQPLGATRPDIPVDSLSPVTPITYAARDGLAIHGYLTLPKGAPKGPIPFVVMPHGGPSARDTLGFDYIAQMLASRGYGVLQPNFRGSKGYGGTFEQAGFQQWGLAMQDDVTDGAQWLIDRKLADPVRICIVGWSYGGYAALMGAVKTPDLFRCAVSIAGVSDLRRRLDLATGSRFADLNVPRIDTDPAVIEANSPVLHADRIKIPILLVHGRRDFTVSVADSEAMEQALRQAGKPVQTLYFADDDHYLFRERDRIAFLQTLADFLAENLGPGAMPSSHGGVTN